MPTVTTRHSYFKRVKGAFVALVIGAILFLVSFPVLFLNEGRAVKTARALKEGGSVVISIGNEEVVAGHEGKFVHVSGLTKVSTGLRDDYFGVEAEAIRLNRMVEMYQWNERKESRSQRKTGGEQVTVTEYSYDQGWHEALIDSSQFQQPTGHENPTTMPFSSQTLEADEVHVGVFQLPRELIRMISRPEELAVNLHNVPQEHSQNLRPLRGTAEAAGGFLWKESMPVDSDASQETTKIGDVRVQFRVTRPTEVSILAKQTQNQLTPYATSNGRQLHMLSLGIKSADEMISQAEAANTALTWGLRILGSVLMFAGILLVLRPLSVIADVLPIVGSLVGYGTALIAALITGMLASLTVSIAWLTYRPLIGIPLLLLSAASAYFLRRTAKKAEHPLPQAHLADLPEPEVVE